MSRPSTAVTTLVAGAAVLFVLAVPRLARADNQPPEIGLPFSSVIATEDTPLVLPPITVSDPDAGDASIKMRLSCTDGDLTLASTGGLTFSIGDGLADAVVEGLGSLADWNVALDGITFIAPADYFGTVRLDVHADDLGWTGAGGELTDDASAAIHVASVNDAPVLGSVPASVSAMSDEPLAITPLAVVSDVDAGDGLLRCMLSISDGRLTLGSTVGMTFIQGDGHSDRIIWFQAGLDDMNAGLASVTYLGDPEYVGSDLISLTVNDMGYSGSGGQQVTSAVVEVTVEDSTDRAVETWSGIKRLYQGGRRP